MKKIELTPVRAGLLLIPVLVLFTICSNVNEGTPSEQYFISGSRAEQSNLEEFFYLLTHQPEGSREQLAVVMEIANSYLKQREYNRLINFLSSRIHSHPDDPYNAYYLFMIAFSYGEMGAHPMAAMYFDMIVRNYPDLEVMGQSIHLASLNQLINLVDNPQQIEWYYEELISRFLDKIDPGPSFFMLGQAHEATGEWNEAIKAYTRYLSFMGSNVPGFPDADSYARRLVDFNNSAKDWTFESLNVLVDAVKEALDAGSANRLWSYHAKANFFTRTWEHDSSNVEGVAGHVNFNLSDFMRGNRIRYADTLDASSNANEAFLRTWGWSQHIPTWYLYFRKIHFPPDPEIHGRWEWAGIFYGERF
ncbi:MAG: tetratricopeptide repeat protein [Treponema sp.]|nr:tetratricopeptide repeat protein [Treponema sp.]